MRQHISNINVTHVGQSVPRVEDDALLSGRGRYGDDIGVRPGTLHAAVLRSPHAHAELLQLEASAALAMPGVRAVLTGEDVQRWSQPFVVGVKQPMEHWALAVDRVRYVGEAVAVVIAESRYLAEDALDAIRVSYRSLPAVIDIEKAMTPEAPVLHPAVGSNVVSDRSFSYGDAPTAFAQAAHRVALTVRYPRNSCTPIECGVVVAEHLPGDEGYDVLSNFMGPFSLHAVMALALQVPGNKLRHRIPRDSGGSFGVKQAVFPYVVLMCLASRKAGAPVKWVEDRLEHLTAATSATARLTHIEAAVTAGGRIVALRYDQMDEVGGYLRAPEPATFYRMHGALTGAYDIAHLEVRNRVVLTNKTPTGLVRGFGGPQVYFALERLMDRIASELGIDPFELRRQNFVQAGQFPYQAAAGAVLDSGDYVRALELARQQADMPALYARRDAARAAGKLYGIGCAAIVEPSVSNMGYISTVLTAG
ncbi:MAG TPA: molybdopterin cofactor-binding domain-containing protein, partial [Telluria sp.]|nr:molybdopterin cofactor-binding domain-containing protein [Telluria sp.]